MFLEGSHSSPLLPSVLMWGQLCFLRMSCSSCRAGAELGPHGWEWPNPALRVAGKISQGWTFTTVVWIMVVLLWRKCRVEQQQKKKRRRLKKASGTARKNLQSLAAYREPLTEKRKSLPNQKERRFLKNLTALLTSLLKISYQRWLYF